MKTLLAIIVAAVFTGALAAQPPPEIGFVDEGWEIHNQSGSLVLIGWVSFMGTPNTQYDVIALSWLDCNEDNAVVTGTVETVTTNSSGFVVAYVGCGCQLPQQMGSHYWFCGANVHRHAGGGGSYYSPGDFVPDTEVIIDQ